MKTLKYKYFIALIAIFTYQINAYCLSEASKNISKIYDVNKGNTLSVENKFGDIDIYHWDKDQVTVDVKITVYHSNDEKANKLLDYIQIEFFKSENEIKIVTVFSEGFDRISNSIFSIGGNNFSIKYKISTPEYLNLDISNKYGNTYVSSNAGNARFEIKYGNLKVNKLINENKNNRNYLDLGYGNATISECSPIEIFIKYSNLDIEKSHTLLLNSRYSKLNLGQTNSLITDSKYDSYNIEKIKKLEINAEYSNYKIGILTKKLVFDSKYTNLKTEYIDKDFDNINIINKYGTIKLGIDGAASYRIEGNADYCEISYPFNSSVSRIQDNTSLQIKGVIGSEKNTDKSIYINSKYGNVTLDE